MVAAEVQHCLQCRFCMDKLTARKIINLLDNVRELGLDLNVCMLGFIIHCGKSAEFRGMSRVGGEQREREHETKLRGDKG